MKFIKKISLLLSLWALGQIVMGQPLNQETVIDKIIVKVNDEILLKSELEISIYQAEMNGFPEEERNCKVLESLIINKMLLAQAEMDSVVVEESMVDAQLDRRMQYFILQFGGEEEMEKAYGKPVNELKEELRPQLEEQLVMQKMQEKLMSKVTVTPEYVKKFFKKIPKDSLPYFPTEVEAGQIVKFPEVNPEQKQKAIDQLVDFKSRILTADDPVEEFKSLALLYSEDPGSSGKGGELGWFGKGELVPPYEAAAKKLKPGEISDPVESTFGFHIIQLIERRGTKYNTRHILVKPDASNADGESARKYLIELRQNILNDSVQFEQAARKYSDDDMVTKSSGGMFTNPATASSKMPLDQLESEVYFILDSMKVGQISEPIEYKAPDGKKGFRIVYFKAKTNPHYANLTDDYIKISEAALNDKKSLALEEWFKSAKGRMYINIDQDYNGCNILN